MPDIGDLFTSQDKPRHILVLDLDETLVHVATSEPYHQLPSCTEGLSRYLDANLSLRPHLAQFLQAMTANFAEVVLFTAAQREYADCVLKLIDPQNKIFTRKFYRDSCTLVEKEFKKDLRIVAADLSNVVLVDNSPSVMMQPGNGYPVLSFNGDPCDCALIDLKEVLLSISKFDDVRVGVQMFKEKFVSAFSFLPELPCLDCVSQHSGMDLSRALVPDVHVPPFASFPCGTGIGSQPLFGWLLPFPSSFA